MDPAREAYAALAPIYDEFTHRNDYEEWFRVLLPELEKRGLRRGRLLDVGCGTGRAFEPMLQRGWEVVGCDLSPEMLAEARRKFGKGVRLEQADVRSLPAFGEFELAWALNEVFAYLVDAGDLERALTAMRANLSANGLAVFDIASLSLLQTNFTPDGPSEMTVGTWRWTGLSDHVVPGGTYEARISGGGVTTHIHRQRHFTPVQVRAAMEAAGLELVAALGQRDRPGAIALFDPPDETRHDRVVYIGALPN